MTTQQTVPVQTILTLYGVNPSTANQIAGVSYTTFTAVVRGVSVNRVAPETISSVKLKIHAHLQKLGCPLSMEELFSGDALERLRDLIATAA